MALYYVHFFKERNAEISVESLIHYFQTSPHFTTHMEDNKVLFVYEHPVLGFQGRFILTPKSIVPNLYKLSSKYLNINFHFETSILLPSYSTHMLFEEVKKCVQHFNLYCYNDLFDDILNFRIELLDKTYEMIKKAYIEKNPLILEDYHMLPKEKLSAILRYQADVSTLEKHYENYLTYVPSYQFFITKDQGLKTAIDWQDLTSTVFPPYLDYVIYQFEKGTKMILYKEVKDVLNDMLESVPGFIRNTDVLMPQYVKKAHKKIKKASFTNMDLALRHASLNDLLDI